MDWHSILHVLGLCGDSHAHLDLLDVFYMMGDSQFMMTVKLFFKRLFGRLK